VRAQAISDRASAARAGVLGCDRYCAPDRMLCGNGSERTQHPVELFGADWLTFGLDDAAPEQRARPLLRNPAADR
jgi:hypothetical protein